MIINAVIGIVSGCVRSAPSDSLAIVDAGDGSARRYALGGARSGRCLDDVIDLTLGDQVSVDGDAVGGPRIDESLLTEESRAPVKQGGQLLAGTSVVAGSCRMVTTAVGECVYAQGLSSRRAPRARSLKFRCRSQPGSARSSR